MRRNFSSIEVEGDVDAGVGRIAPYQHPRRPGRNGAEFGRESDLAEFGAPVDDVSDNVDIAPVNNPWKQRSRIAPIRMSMLSGLGRGLGDDDDEVSRLCRGFSGNEYLSHGMLDPATPCNPMSGKAGLPACPRYIDIPSSVDPKGDCIEYARRFFHVAVKFGLLSPEGSPLQKLFNCSAGIYWTVVSGIDGRPLGPGEGSTINMLAVGDRNTGWALRNYEKGSPSVRVPWEELPPHVQEVFAPIDTPPLATKKSSKWPAVAAGLAAAGFLFAVFGQKKADKYRDDESGSRDPLAPPMSGLDDVDDVGS